MSNKLIGLFPASFATLFRSRLCSYFAFSSWTLMMLQIASYQWFHTHIVTNNVVGQMVCELSLRPTCMTYTNLVEVWMCLSHWNSNCNQWWLEITYITWWQRKSGNIHPNPRQGVKMEQLHSYFVHSQLFYLLAYAHENVWKPQYFHTLYHKSSLMPHDLDINLLPAWPMFFAVERCHL